MQFLSDGTWSYFIRQLAVEPAMCSATYLMPWACMPSLWHFSPDIVSHDSGSKTSSSRKCSVPLQSYFFFFFGLTWVVRDEVRISKIWPFPRRTVVEETKKLSTRCFEPLSASVDSPSLHKQRQYSVSCCWALWSQTPANHISICASICRTVPISYQVLSDGDPALFLALFFMFIHFRETE